MPAQLLSTNTTTYGELVGNGRRLVVPPFQRDYSWSEEQWEDLWSDVLLVLSEQERVHYMGAIVLEERSDRVGEIIDGQQRVATLSTLALAVISALDALASAGHEAVENRERSQLARTLYIATKDPTSLTYSSKLALNRSNDDFFQTYLVQGQTPPNPRGLSPSNRLLWDSFVFFQQKLAELPEERRNGRSLAELLNDVIARRLHFITIRVQDDTSAYTVFETLNARGLELTASDLLKNYLFSLLSGSRTDQERLGKLWDSIVRSVGQAELPSFLRFYLLLHQSRVRKNRLFHELRDRVADRTGVFPFVHDLEQYAELFSALGDPTHEFWRDTPEQRSLIRELVVLGSRQPYPLLFAVHRRFEPADLTRVLKLVVALSFRYQVIAELNPNALEPAYAEAASDVMKEVARTPRDVFERLREVYVEDTRFRQTFMYAALRSAGQRRKLTRYVLAKLESGVSGRNRDWETDPFTVEHVLPENPGPAWDPELTRDGSRAWIDRIGNLTLLEPTKNRDVGNDSFARKSTVYATSGYELTRRIDGTEWSKERIEARQDELAAIAARVWRSDFA
jgi:hypothetical protein